MRNITIALDDETARWARIEAARQDMSVSRLVSNLLQENMRRNGTYEVAMQRYLSMPSRSLNEAGGPYPTREEIHDRASFR